MSDKVCRDPYVSYISSTASHSQPTWIYIEMYWNKLDRFVYTYIHGLSTKKLYLLVIGGSLPIKI